MRLPFWYDFFEVRLPFWYVFLRCAPRFGMIFSRCASRSGMFFRSAPWGELGLILKILSCHPAFAGLPASISNKKNNSSGSSHCIFRRSGDSTTVFVVFPIPIANAFPTQAIFQNRGYSPPTLIENHRSYLGSLVIAN